MPKTIPDYSKSCIYKLLHKEDFNNENIYVGSTTNFIQRKKSHKKTCNNTCEKSYNMNLYQHIRANGGWENWVMIQIEPFSCNSKKELETRERYWIEILKSKLNCVIPTRTQKEYRNDNIDIIKENLKKYYKENANKIIEQHKKYYNDNKDKILEYKKKYRRDNIDKILEYKTEKVQCDNCGCNVRKDCLVRHKRSKKCINFQK